MLQSAMRKMYFIFLLCLSTLSVHAAENSSLPATLQKIEQKYKKAQTLKAEFFQQNQVASVGRTRKSNGLIWLKRPDKIRWETQKPDPNLLVSDGKTFWFYTPPFEKGENGQVIVRRTAEVQSQLASALLSGRFSLAKDITYKELGADHFKMTPRPGTSGDVMTAEIFTQGNLIKKVILNYRSGNRSEIVLKKIQLGQKLDDSDFNFQPPKGTERIVQ